jgi:hypothetical protein
VNLSKKGIKIYEPQYIENTHIKNEDVTPFIFDNSHPEWREFYLITEIFKSIKWANCEYSGVLSPKFRMKAKITIKDFKSFVNANSGHDVYFINPFPQMAYFYFNIWDQGEIFHPGITHITQRLLNAVGIPWELDKVGRTSHELLGYCNYWVGNKKFWQEYVGNVLNPIRLFLEKNKDPGLIRELFSLTTHSTPSPMFPFIIERLFSTFLHFSPDIKCMHYPSENLTESYCLNDVEEQILRYVKSFIDQMDANKVVNHTERALMMGLGFAMQQFALEYYSRRPYPYTGNSIETPI